MAGEQVRDAAGNLLLTGEAPAGAGLDKVMYYVVDGDSLTANDNSTNGVNNWFNFLCASLSSAGVVGKNFAASGKNTGQIVASYNTAGSTPGLAVGGGHQFSPAVTGAKGVYFIWSGTNDMGDGASVVYGRITTLVANAKADGYGKVVVFTVTPRTDWPAGAPAVEAARVAFNALVVANAAGADYVIDVASMYRNPSLGLFYYDGLHLTVFAQRRIALQVQSILNGGALYPQISFPGNLEYMQAQAAEYDGQLCMTADGNCFMIGKSGGNGNSAIIWGNSVIYFGGDMNITGRLGGPAGGAAPVVLRGAVPDNQSVDTLGQTGNRWPAVYAVVGDFSSSVKVGSNVQWSSGAGSPEGVVSAPVGSLFSRTDGGASTTLYVKQSGTGNTGWAAK